MIHRNLRITFGDYDIAGPAHIPESIHEAFTNIYYALKDIVRSILCFVDSIVSLMTLGIYSTHLEDCLYIMGVHYRRKRYKENNDIQIVHMDDDEWEEYEKDIEDK